MTETTILDESDVSEIEAQLNAAGPGGELSVEQMKLMVSFEANQREYVRALCATVKHLRAENQRLKEDRRSLAPASAAPVVDENDLISRAAAKAAMCNMCANRDRYKPAEALEGSMRLFHFQRSDNWNAGQCLAQAIDSLPAATAAPQQPRSNHFPDEALNKGFPDHISKDGTAYYSDGTVLPSAAPVEQSEHVHDYREVKGQLAPES